MLFKKVRFCLAKGELIREVECAICKLSPAQRYDRRMEERRSEASSAEQERRSSSGRRKKKRALCPGLLRMALLKISYPLFKTPYAGALIITALAGAVLAVATIKLELLPRRTDAPETALPSAEAAVETDARKQFLEFAMREQRSFTDYADKNKYSIQLVLSANRIIDAFLKKYARLPESVPGAAVDEMFMDAFDFYLNGANVLFENYFYVDDAQLPQLIRRLDLLLMEAETLFEDWQKVNSRLPVYANSHIHSVYSRKITNSLALFRGNITKLKSGNVIKEPLIIPSLDIKKL